MANGGQEGLPPWSIDDERRGRRQAGTELWKYLATVAVTILLAGTPGMLYAIRTWGIQADVQQIRDRQDDVRQRLSVVEQQQKQLSELITLLRTELQLHVQQEFQLLPAPHG